MLLGSANGEPHEGELCRGEGMLDEIIALRPVGALVATIIKLDAEHGVRGTWPCSKPPHAD